MYFEPVSGNHWRSWWPASTQYAYNGLRLRGGTSYHDDAYGSLTAAGHRQIFYVPTIHTGRWHYCSRNCKYYQVPYK